MKKFIALSEASKKIIQIARMSSTLPVNVLIFGPVGVGKRLLANEILPNSQSFKAKELEKFILDDNINLAEYDSLIIYNIKDVLNKKEFLESLEGIKLVITNTSSNQDYLNSFPVKIEILPLEQRKEDLEELTNIYIKEANKIYETSKVLKDIKIDLSTNGISLKKSIFKSIALQSINEKDIENILYNLFLSELEKEKDYKTLLKIFEIPLLNASKKLYSSQLKMSKKLNINRITLRKKIAQYFER